MPGRMPTIYDVAKRAGVSTYTVSSVMNKSAFVSPELTARVEKAVLELDYTPNAVARSLQTRNTQTIGMLIPDIGNPFYATVVQGVEEGNGVLGRIRRVGQSAYNFRARAGRRARGHTAGEDEKCDQCLHGVPFERRVRQ